MVTLPEIESNKAVVAGERAREAIENMPLEISGENIFITVSIGIASYPEHGTEIKEIMNKTDRVLYKSKKEGKKRSTVFSD